MRPDLTNLRCLLTVATPLTPRARWHAALSKLPPNGKTSTRPKSRLCTTTRTRNRGHARLAPATRPHHCDGLDDLHDRTSSVFPYRSLPAATQGRTLGARDEGTKEQTSEQAKIDQQQNSLSLAGITMRLWALPLCARKELVNGNAARTFPARARAHLLCALKELIYGKSLQQLGPRHLADAPHRCEANGHVHCALKETMRR